MFMDRELARRLEATEGAVGASFGNAESRDFGGTRAIFGGVDSPITQTFGLGVCGDVGALDEIEAFFRARGAATMHEISPLAGIATVARLAERGYRPIELSTVLVQPIADVRVPDTSLVCRPITPADRDAWIETSIRGWSNDPEAAEMIRVVLGGSAANPAQTCFLVERDGVPVATGALGFHDGIALLAGASTVPEERGRGAQTLLLATRLAEAHRRGCELAMMVTEPGSTSQRNSERRGFRVAYTRTKWRLS